MKMNIVLTIYIYIHICLGLCVFMVSSVSSLDQERKLYIAYMGPLPKGEYSPASHHSQIIKQIVDPSFASKSLIRSYERSFNGFSAYLSEEEKEKLTRIVGVVSVFPCQKSQLQTTRSWDFIGLSTTTHRRPVVESETIIGVIDGGIWPELDSFSDEGFGPIPTKWKGACDGGKDFTCNKKIIGARTFSVQSKEHSARDTDGHGTHVASILAGNQVIDANYYGLANGIARGGVPSARLAIYKVCDPDCPDTNILSAFDHAIADGVDIISLSINHHDPMDLTLDAIAIGAFHAMERGILTVNAAGNDGPSLSSINSYAPWILHVGASDTDRKIVDKVLLKNDAILVGNAINGFPSSDEALSLVYGKEVTTSCSDTDARKCRMHCLNSSLIKQKVVLCDQHPNLGMVKTYGALGCIFPDMNGNSFSKIMPLPTIVLSSNSINLIKAYKSSTTKPEVQILKSETIGNLGAPFVASFSARGPSIFMPDVIKPDVMAPGVEILSAYSPIGSPSHDPLDKNSVTFNILSGTSMACPHVTAVAVVVKSFHPEWSPSAIKSALMTTGEFNASLYPEAEFAYGSGRIDPLKAINPGLVYETSAQDYLRIWCNLSRMPGSVILTSNTCTTKVTPKDINYPSMAVQVEVKYPFMVHFPRTVTNVGQANSTYVASIEGDYSNLLVTVAPNALQFTSLIQKMDFLVTVWRKGMKPRTLKRISLVWIDGARKVRSPIVVYSLQEISNGETTQTPTPSRFHLRFVILVIMILLH